MSPKVQVHVPVPCHEDWGTMRPEEQGRFCLSCQKTVVDFTKMTDHEMIGYFHDHASAKICGRFNDSQVIAPAKAPARYSFLKAIAAVSAGLFIALLNSCRPLVIGKTTGELVLPPSLDASQACSSTGQNTSSEFMGDSVIVEVKGESTFVPEVISLRVDSPVQLEHYIMGEMPFYPEEKIIDTPAVRVKDAQGN